MYAWQSLGASASKLCSTFISLKGTILCSEDDLCVVATRADLAAAEKLLKLRLIAHHQARGVTFRDPEGTFLVPSPTPSGPFLLNSRLHNPRGSGIPTSILFPLR